MSQMCIQHMDVARFPSLLSKEYNDGQWSLRLNRKMEFKGIVEGNICIYTDKYSHAGKDLPKTRYLRTP